MTIRLLRRSFFVLFILATCALSAGEQKTAVIDIEKADADFAIQGEYTGDVTIPGRDTFKAGMQVIARGNGKFHAEFLSGGLPGDGWDKGKKIPLDGETTDGVTTLKGTVGSIDIKDGKMTLNCNHGGAPSTLKRVVRESPTSGLKAPDGALVIFDGTNLDQFQKGAKMSDDKLVEQGANTLKPLQNFTLHLEFKLAYMPEAGGQGRSNSGCYLQSRYEIQILDSFGLKGENNECGGIYTIRKPDVNMCYPPLSWQTYDIDYTAAKFEDGKKVKNATATVKHNGVLIHENAECTHATTSAPMKEGPEPAPIHLQNHGSPVRFKNIWVVEKP
jgi:hypothetical protein